MKVIKGICRAIVRLICYLAAKIIYRVKIEGIEKEITLNKYENTGEYGIRMQITGNDKIKDGEMKLTISGYTDKAGNEGKTLNNDDSLNFLHKKIK